jgi:hypothetical protein
MKSIHLPILPVTLLSAFFCLPATAADRDSSPLNLNARDRVKDASAAFQTRESVIRWAPQKTVIVVCDMWDKHWCKGATARVAEMAPRMNAVQRRVR